MSRRAAALRGLALGLGLLLTLLVPAAALAHGGSVVAVGGNDAYRLTVEAADTRLENGANAVDLTAYPVRLSNGASDLKADVEITIDGGEPIRLKPVGDGLETLVPVRKRGAWRSWTVRATLDGAAGTLQVAGKPETVSDRSGPPVGVLVGSLALLVLLGAAAVIVRRRRDAAAPTPAP